MSRGSRLWWIGHTTGWLLTAVLALGVVRLMAGEAMFEKSLKALVAPTGLIWMALFLTGWLAMVRRFFVLAGLAFVAWGLLTVSGNSYVVQWMADRLQQPYLGCDLRKAPTPDVLLLLGGGTSSTPSGDAQASQGGDRIMVTTRLARTGQVRTVVCSGTRPLGPFAGLPAASGEAAALLESLGVAPERIARIGGRNTSQELQEFANWLQEHPQPGGTRLGLVTSAWHMPRALRLARAAGLDMEPVPADFLVVRPRESPHLLIPGAKNLLWSETLLHEYLAGLVGR